MVIQMSCLQGSYTAASPCSTHESPAPVDTCILLTLFATQLTQSGSFLCTHIAVPQLKCHTTHPLPPLPKAAASPRHCWISLMMHMGSFMTTWTKETVSTEAHAVPSGSAAKRCTGTGHTNLLYTLLHLFWLSEWAR